jgi:hypothetical protein
VSELLARADQLLYARKRRRQLTKVSESHQRERVSHNPSRRAPRLAPLPIPAELTAMARAAATPNPIAAPPTSAVVTALKPPMPSPAPDAAGVFRPTHAA